MIIGNLETKPIQDHDEELKPIGYFDLPVNIDAAKLLTTSDPKGFISFTIAQHLASACKDTAVPSDYWRFVSLPAFAREYDFPPVLSFDRRRKQ